MATSRYDTSIKVKQEVIDRIKKMGMKAATEAANSGKESAEFVEGAKRMYGGRVGASNAANLKKRQNEASASPLARRAPTLDSGSTAPAKDEKKPVEMPPSAPASASRRNERTTAEQALGTRNAEQVRKVTTPISNVASNLAGSRAATLEGVTKSLGNFYDKNIGKSLGNIFGGKKKRK